MLLKFKGYHPEVWNILEFSKVLCDELSNGITERYDLGQAI